MQFHLNGFRAGDPRIAPAMPDGDRNDALPADVDVLIVGCGPAGLTLAAQMAQFPGIRTAIVEQKDGPLELGQADGIACRTVEMFNAFGFAEEVLREAYWVNETSFWRPDGDGTGIARASIIDDTEDGLSEFPHVILNQARVHDRYLEVMRNSPHRMEPNYSRRFAGLEIGTGDYPVTVTLERTDPDHAGQTETVRARYVVGCDGARSGVSTAIGQTLRGDSANVAWGVMDVLCDTDFPDIRRKALIQSPQDGNIVLIPREGGYLARIYVELDKLGEDERVSARDITADKLIAAAQRIFRPYRFEVKDVAWWSCYQIGQRLCDRFDDVPQDLAPTRTPRVFIAGDACHTHSPKAGQGMNVSMRDAFNLGWKLAAVLRGQADASLLHSYTDERQGIAQALIDFDREWASMISKRAASGTEAGVDPDAFRRYFIKSGRYTAGTEEGYAPSRLTAEATHQTLASGFIIGKRFHSAPVIRMADGKPLHLGHTVTADGRWRLFAFAGRDGDLTALCDFLQADPRSPLLRHTPEGQDIDNLFDLRGVFQTPHREMTVNDLPPLLFPAKGRLGLHDYEKAFCADPRADIYDTRGIDRKRGALVIVRPDQHVAHVLPLDAHAELATFLGGIFLPQSEAQSDAA
ncbi:FAD-binding monooxygenase [Anianabacter salinae]|uniref:FAD-binding monooxygenase n=1 Tax=Anianabacter salinae TaxID=2851023 RepID=UPI00225E09E3|nr:FAD-binding monooxygenase [Anianabacter salinae]MBV0913671.1 FAD-binding monooxygenase [Anianabacter salinae]